MMAKKDIWLEALIEIWNIKLKDIYYEVHVDATDERRIVWSFAEVGEVTDEIKVELEKMISKIDHT